MAKAYNPYSVDDDYEDEEEEVAAAKWNWGKKNSNIAKSLGKRSQGEL